MSEAVRYPWDTAPPRIPASPEDAPNPQAKRRGRRLASVSDAALRTPGGRPDWLYHHLAVSGPADGVAAFAAAARGAGVTPWQLDFASLEDDLFVRAVAQPASRRILSVAGCRILARQFRECVEARQARAAARVGHSRACPFDLQALLPVPAAILRLGPTHPTALTWLAGHWGITDRLRQVVVRETATAGRRLPSGHTVISYGFFTDGETPHAAIAALTPDWPTLRLSLVPRPAD